MTKTYKKRYAWGRLAVKADFANASSPIRYATDSDIQRDDFSYSVFQVADARHSPAKALSLVNSWLRGQSNPSKRKTHKRVASALKKYVAGALKKANPGRKVKGGRAVSLRNFTGTVIRKSNGQVVIEGQSKKK